MNEPPQIHFRTSTLNTRASIRLLAGDFNTLTPRFLNAVGSALSRGGLDCAPIPNDPHTRTQGLDQVFCRGLDVVSVEIDTTIRNSDHFPILMRLTAR